MRGPVRSTLNSVPEIEALEDVLPPSQEPVSPAVETVPDPGQAGTLDDLVERLRLLKVWAGDPSYERITDRVNTAWSAAGRPAG